MHIRIALVPLVAVVALTAPTAGAAPKKAAPACQLITDAAGDTFAVRSQDQQGQYGPQEDGLDITSADLASDGKVVTAVVRIKKLARSIALSPTGMTVGIDFIIGSSDSVVRLQAALPAGGTDRFEVASKAADAVANTPMTYVGAATGVVDLAKSEVRITAPAAMLAPFGAVKPGVKLTPNDAESATAARSVPPVTTTPGQPMSSRGPFADVALGGKPAVVGAPSCVVPGK